MRGSKGQQYINSYFPTNGQMAIDGGHVGVNDVPMNNSTAFVLRSDHDAALRRAKAEAKEYAWDEAAMRAACAAHRACCGVEADNAQGKIHGCCVVCGVPWPCETAQFFLLEADARAAQIEEGE